MLRTIGIALLLVLPPADSSNAQTPLTALDEVFSEELDVSLVELDVLVFDGKGNAVRGLRAEDFRVLEEKVERPIVSFGEVVSPTLRARLGVEQPPASPWDGDELETPEETLVMLFVDHPTLAPSRRARVLHFLDRYLESVPSGAVRFGLVLNDRPLRVAIAPTSDRGAFRRQVAALPKPPASSTRAELDRREAIEALSGPQDPAPGKSRVDRASTTVADCPGRMASIGAIGRYIDGAERRNQRTLLGLDATVTMLGGVEGTKVLLYVGEGPELQPGLEMALRASFFCADLRSQVDTLAGPLIERDLRGVAANANAYRVTLYALDAGGPRLGEDFAERGAIMDPELRQARASNLQGSMFILADETGGRLFRNLGDVRPHLERLERDLEHRYEIAYEAPPEPGRVRRVKVEIRKERLEELGLGKVRVLHRSAIRSIGENERLVAQLFAALWLGNEDNELDVGVFHAEPETAGRTGVGLRVPYDSLVLDEATPPERLRIFLMARDEESGARTLPKEHFEELTPARLEKGRSEGQLEFVVDMDLPEGRWNVAVGVRDETTSRTAAVLLTEANGQSE